MLLAVSSSLHTRERAIMEDEQGFSGLFYVMLMLGIVGVLGFVLVAVGGS
jgi:hypothetical protein